MCFFIFFCYCLGVGVATVIFKTCKLGQKVTVTAVTETEVLQRFKAAHYSN